VTVQVSVFRRRATLGKAEDADDWIDMSVATLV
jgi:hypothetical protein